MLKLFNVSGYTSLRRLRCEVTEAIVIVHGVVPSYYLKQMAQTIIQRLEGVQSVINLVEVRETDSCSWDNEEDAAASQSLEVALITHEFVNETSPPMQPTTNPPHNLLAKENQR